MEFVRELVVNTRYVLTVAIEVMLLPGIVYWFVIHPLAPLWRRIGRAWALGAAIGGFGGTAVFLFLIRASLTGADLGTEPWLWLPAAVLIGGGVTIDVAARKHLSFRILSGMPELASEPSQSQLLTGGIYGRVRNPRYVAMILGLTGYALFANHAGLYIYLALALPLIWPLVVLEERELKGRFGAEYEAYMRETPRFLPRPR